MGEMHVAWGAKSGDFWFCQTKDSSNPHSIKMAAMATFRRHRVVEQLVAIAALVAVASVQGMSRRQKSASIVIATMDLWHFPQTQCLRDGVKYFHVLYTPPYNA